MSAALAFTMTLTAFTSCDPGMRCDGVMANGHQVFEGAAACPPDWAFGIVFYVPSLRRWGICADRGDAIGPGRLDLWMKDRGEALRFGKRELQVVLPWGIKKRRKKEMEGAEKAQSVEERLVTIYDVLNEAVAVAEEVVGGCPGKVEEAQGESRMFWRGLTGRSQ